MGSPADASGSGYDVGPWAWKIRQLKEDLESQLIREVSGQVQDVVNKFIEKTGLTVSQVKFSFIDCRTFDGALESVISNVTIHHEYI